MKNLLGLLLFVGFSLPLAVLPLSLSIRAGELLGLFVFYLWGSRRRIAIENLKKAAGRKGLTIPDGGSAARIIRDNFLNMGRSLAEVIKIYYGLGGKIIGRVEIEGRKHYDKAKKKGRGVVLITGHCGNWELMALAFSVNFGKAGVVARPLNNPYLNRFLERARKKYGNSVIYKKGALKGILSALKSGGNVGILMDQSVVADEGVLIDFLGSPAWTTRMPAAILKKTGAAAVPVFISRRNRGHVMKFYPEVELRGDEVEDTKSLSGYIEDYVRVNPSEWLWIHRRWKSRGRKPLPNQ